MSKVIMIVSFELNNQNLIEDWKKMSAKISADLEGVDGFIYRDSAISNDNKVYCILKWNSLEQSKKFRATIEAREDWPQLMADFSKIVNMETMTQEVLEVF